MGRIAAGQCGLEFAVETSGSSGAVVLVVHGSPLLHGCWPLLGRPELTNTLSVVHPFRRGYRGRPTPALGFSIEDQARDLARLIQAIDRPVHLLGHSLGAVIALQIGLSRLDNLQSLILFEPTWFHRDVHLRWVDNVSSDIVKTYGRGDRQAALHKMLTLTDGPTYAGRFSRSLPDDWFEAAAGALDLYFSIEMPASLAWNPTAEAFASIEQPVLLVSGDATQAVFGEICTELAQLLPAARLAHCAHAGHNVIATVPEQAAELIASFLFSIGPSGRPEEG